MKDHEVIVKEIIDKFGDNLGDTFRILQVKAVEFKLKVKRVNITAENVT